MKDRNKNEIEPNILNRESFELTEDLLKAQFLNKYGIYEKYPQYEQDLKKIFDKVHLEEIESFTELLDDLIFKAEGNLNLGRVQKRRSYVFAKEIGEKLDMVRKEGFTSQRAIAKRFNDLGIKSYYGGEWSQNTVKNILQRRKEFGFE